LMARRANVYMKKVKHGKGRKLFYYLLLSVRSLRGAVAVTPPKKKKKKACVFRCLLSNKV